MSIKTKKPREYRQITPATVAQHKALKALHGNGTSAVRYAEPTRLAPKDRAFRIAKKSEAVSTADFIDNQMQQIGIDAVHRLGKLINSSDERVAGKMVTYTIDQIRGQAVRRSIALTGKLNIQNALD